MVNKPFGQQDFVALMTADQQRTDLSPFRYEAEPQAQLMRTQITVTHAQLKPPYALDNRPGLDRLHQARADALTPLLVRHAEH